MLHVKNVVHNLRVKWMAQLSLDRGFTWSRMIWLRITTKMPSMLLQGLRHVLESCLQEMDPFYAQILQSYTYLNNLFYSGNKSLDLPINLWGHPKLKNINYHFCHLDFYTLADLPLTSNNQINHIEIQNKFKENKIHYSSFLVCYHLQNVFSKYLPLLVMGLHLVKEELLAQSKYLLLQNSSTMLLLSKWEIYFRLMPLSKPFHQIVFWQMLQSCKYS